MNIVIESLEIPPPSSRPVEIVERKGIGHPDTICDAVAEQLSVAPCRFYYERFGWVLHHNVDKVLLWGGIARPAFGGGEVLAPSEIFLTGRVTKEFQGIPVLVEDLARASCRDWLRQNFHILNPDKHVKIHCLLRPGSVDLVELYARQQKTGLWLANDTSIGVGFAPLSQLEQVVLSVEKYLNSLEVKNSYPEIGEDIKVMGVRRENSICLTLACAFVDRFVTNIDDYCHQKARLQKMVLEAASSLTDQHLSVEVNTGDNVQEGNVYLTVTGTSAEAGDDGETGRGNRVNGLITPYRPMTLEAAAGKNPVSHVGKLYNIVANQIAAAIVEEIAEVTTAYCYLVSQIGKPVNEPQVIDLQVQTLSNQPVEEFCQGIESIARTQLMQIDTLWQKLVNNEYFIY